MAKKFNVTAVCMPDKHYMVNIEERLRQIKDLILMKVCILRSTGLDNMERQQHYWRWNNT